VGNQATAERVKAMATAVRMRGRRQLSLVLTLLAGSLCFGQPRYTAHPPMGITACGQASDASGLSLLSARLHIDHVFDRSMSAERLEGIRTLVVVIGGSVRGLDDRAIDESREISRVRAMLAKARRLGVAIIGVHVGGESRRGAASDRLIEPVIEQADYLIVTEAGNQDGLFTRAARTRMVPLVIVSEPADVARELRAVMALQ
jgi:hypothetical protein